MESRPPYRPSTLRPDGAHLVRTKGTSLAAIVRFVRQNWGRRGLARLAAASRTPEVLELIDGKVLAGSWYPFAYFTELLDNADALFGGGVEGFARREGASCADYDLRGVYRVFVRFTSPSFVIERSGKVWRQYYDSGDLVVLETDDARVLYELRDFGSPHRGHCGTVLGWSERAAELSGATAVRGAHSDLPRPGRSALRLPDRLEVKPVTQPSATRLTRVRSLSMTLPSTVT